MHVQSDTPSLAAQQAPPELTHLEETCGRMIREHGTMKHQLDVLQQQSTVQVQALRDEQKRRLHAERMQVAVELRLDDLDEQNDELLKALELLYEAVQTPQSDSAFETMLSFALGKAKALIDVHQPQTEGVAA
jgi:type II secretory pathway predicted ATPase ExeA